MATNLKLSDAIRAGAKLRPQGFGKAFKNGCSCAWGAAWEGSGLPYDESIDYIDIMGLHDWIKGNQAVRKSLGLGVAMSNDNLKMTREGIADILQEHGL